MSESISYSVSFSSGPPKPPPSALSGLYLRDAVEVIPLSGDQVLVWNPRSGTRCALNRNALPALEHCNRFRTLPEHAGHIAEAMSGLGVSVAEVEALLGQFRDQRLLVSGEQIRERFLAGANDAESDPRQQASAWTLAIITCDRPGSLRRLVESARPWLREVSPAPRRIVLADDSRNPELLRHNAELCRSESERLGVAIEHWDRAARAALAAHLAAECPQAAEAIAWILSPEAVATDAATTGQGRNLATLLSAGECLLTLDDDCVIDPRLGEEAPSPLRVGDWPNRPHAYLEREQLHSRTRAAEVNPLSAHLAALGAGPEAVFRQLGADSGDPQWLAGLDADAAARLHSGCHVRTTFNATIGDPGTGSMEWLYRCPDPESTGLVEYIESLPREASVERLVWRGRPGPFLGLNEALMTTTLTGFDNRDPLPCVLPFGRSEDRCLSDAIAAIDRGALSLAFPWALPHLPEPARSWSRADLARAPGGKPVDNALAQVIYALGVEISGYDAEVRTTALSAALEELADAPEQALTETVVRHGLREAGARLARLQQARAGAREGAWADDLDTLIARLGNAMARPPARDDDWFAAFRLQAGHYGRALGVWPLLWSRLRDHRDEVVNVVLKG